MKWSDVDEHEFTTESLKADYKKWESLATITIISLGVLYLVEVPFFLYTLGVSNFLSSFLPTTPFSKKLPFMASAIFLLLEYIPSWYAKRRLDEIHNSDEVRCYSIHNWKKKKHDEDGPSAYPSVPQPQVRI